LSFGLRRAGLFWGGGGSGSSAVGRQRALVPFNPLSLTSSLQATRFWYMDSVLVYSSAVGAVRRRCCSYASIASNVSGLSPLVSTGASGPVPSLSLLPLVFFWCVCVWLRVCADRRAAPSWRRARGVRWPARKARDSHESRARQTQKRVNVWKRTGGKRKRKKVAFLPRFESLSLRRARQAQRVRAWGRFGLEELCGCCASAGRDPESGSESGERERGGTDKRCERVFFFFWSASRSACVCASVAVVGFVRVSRQVRRLVCFQVGGKVLGRVLALCGGARSFFSRGVERPPPPPADASLALSLPPSALCASPTPTPAPPPLPPLFFCSARPLPAAAAAPFVLVRLPHVLHQP
jgi:hypothetical protein